MPNRSVLSSPLGLLAAPPSSALLAGPRECLNSRQGMAACRLSDKVPGRCGTGQAASQAAALPAACSRMAVSAAGSLTIGQCPVASSWIVQPGWARTRARIASMVG